MYKCTSYWLPPKGREWRAQCRIFSPLKCFFSNFFLIRSRIFSACFWPIPVRSNTNWFLFHREITSLLRRSFNNNVFRLSKASWSSADDNIRSLEPFSMDNIPKYILLLLSARRLSSPQRKRKISGLQTRAPLLFDVFPRFPEHL